MRADGWYARHCPKRGGRSQFLFAAAGGGGSIRLRRMVRRSITWSTAPASKSRNSFSGSAKPARFTGGIARRTFRRSSLKVQMFAGPEPAAIKVFEALMFAARRELIVSSPYFVPTEALLNALCTTAYRGVDTTIIFPARNDSWIVAAA